MPSFLIGFPLPTSSLKFSLAQSAFNFNRITRKMLWHWITFFLVLSVSFTLVTAENIDELKALGSRPIVLQNSLVEMISGLNGEWRAHLQYSSLQNAEAATHWVPLTVSGVIHNDRYKAATLYYESTQLPTSASCFNTDQSAVLAGLTCEEFEKKRRNHADEGEASHFSGDASHHRHPEGVHSEITGRCFFSVRSAKEHTTLSEEPYFNYRVRPFSRLAKANGQEELEYRYENSQGTPRDCLVEWWSSNRDMVSELGEVLQSCLEQVPHANDATTLYAELSVGKGENKIDQFTEEAVAAMSVTEPVTVPLKRNLTAFYVLGMEFKALSSSRSSICWPTSMIIEGEWETAIGGRQKEAQKIRLIQQSSFFNRWIYPLLLVVGAYFFLSFLSWIVKLRSGNPKKH